MDKHQIRKQIRDAKKDIPFFVKRQRSEAVIRSLQTLSEFNDAKTVLLYWSMDDEVQTHELVEQYATAKTILLPCIDGDNLLLRQYTTLEAMRNDPQFGIGEPTGPVFEKTETIDLIVVPGVAFDRECNRMGRGRGFYDRLLSTTPKAKKIGIAFDFQLLDHIAVEPHDIKMDCVVTESEIIINK